MTVAKVYAAAISFAQNLVMLQQPLFSNLEQFLMSKEQSKQIKQLKKKYLELKC